MQDLHGSHHFSFWPTTFVLPKEYDLLQAAMIRNPLQYWINKPSGLAQGKGIYITNNPKEIVKNSSAIVSHYIDNPLTIDQLKFDLRIYVALTSINPLRIYMYEEGLVRFATEIYRSPSTTEPIGESKFVHLTNHSINKKNK